MMLASPIWGMVADRHGRKLMVERAMFGGAVILLVMSFAQSAEQLVLLRTIQGFITGVVGAANALVASVAPRERCGYAMGLLQVGQGTGVALGPMIGGAVADAFGYSAAFYVTSGMLFLAGVTVLLGVQEKFTPKAISGEKRTKFTSQWGQILTRPGVFIAYSMNFSSQLGRMMIVPIVPLFVEILLSNTTKLNTFTGLVIGVSSATMTLSAVYLGRLGDRVGHRRILISSLILTGFLYLPQSLATEGWHLLVLYALVGVGMGGIIPAVGALLAQFTPHGEEGAVYGLDNSIRAGARSLAPMLGSGVTLRFGLRGAYLIAGLIFLGAALLAGWRLPKPNPIPETEVEG
jgi:DHA1 family multidrug resistance protein-like MFS transporter